MKKAQIVDTRLNIQVHSDFLKKKYMLYHVAYMLLIFLLLCMTSSCINDRRKCIRHTASINAKNEKIIIKNHGKSDVFLQLDINRKLLYSPKEITLIIRNITDEFPAEPETRKAWRFVVRQTLHINTGIEDKWMDNPLAVLNSAGFGLCDDLSRVLCMVWAALGYKARIWGLGGHVVAEVLDEGKWQMYDPSFAVYYMNSNGMVAGVEELAHQPWLIHDPIDTLPSVINRSFILAARRYSHDLASLYQSAANNHIIESCELADDDERFEIHLPAGASIEFPVMTPDTITFVDAFREWNLRSFVKYVLPKGWTGTIHLPFVLYHVEGKGMVKLNKHIFQTENDSLNQILARLETHSRQINVIHSSDTLMLYCLFNHAVFNEHQPDSIFICSKQISHISIKTVPNINYRSEPFINFVVEKKISDSARKYYSYIKKINSMSQLPVFNDSMTRPDSASVSESIRLLIYSIKDLSEQEKATSTRQLMHNWAMIYPVFRTYELKKKISFSKDPVYFAYLLGILEHSNIADHTQPAIFKR